jgi:DNA-binding transcriptional regulator YhcF (GntR family)
MDNIRTDSIKDSVDEVSLPCDARLELSPNGWEIYYNGKHAVVFDDIYSIEADHEIAKQLGIDVKEAWRLKNKLLEEWRPRTLYEYRLLFPKIVGEDGNIESMILTLFSQKLKNWRDRILTIIVGGPNSTGKSYMTSTIFEPFNLIFEEKDGRIYKATEDDGKTPIDTDEALGRILYVITSATLSFFKREFTKKNLDRKIIYFQQAENLPLELSFLVSEEGLVFCFSEKIDGRWVPVMVKTKGHPLVVVTAVRFRGSQDWTHRFLELYTDDSASQTRRVVDFKTKLSMDLRYRKSLERFQNGCFKVFINIWGKTPEGLEAVIPFMDILAENIELNYDDPKTRRDYERLIGLLYASAIAFYDARPKIKHGGGEVLIVTEEDLREVYPLLEKTIRYSILGISEKEEKILEKLKEWHEESRVSDKGSWPTIRELAEYAGVNYNTLRSHNLPNLERMGYVYRDRDSRPTRVILIREPLFAISQDVIDKCRERVREYLSISYRSDDQTVSSPNPALNPEKQLLIERSNASDHHSNPTPSLGREASTIDDHGLDHSINGVVDGRNREKDGYSDDQLIMKICIDEQAEHEHRGGIICSMCMHWDALKCLKYPDWIVVTPTARYARKCPFYNPRSGSGEVGHV